MQRMFCFLMVSPLFGPVIKTTFKSRVSINNVLVVAARVADITPVSNVCEQRGHCSGPSTDSTNYRRCVFFISIRPNWQIDNGFFSGPIMTLTQILVHSWRLRTRISALTRRRTYKRFGFVCGEGYGCRHRRDIFNFPIIAFETFWTLR